MTQNAGRSTFKLGLYPFKYRDFLGIMAKINLSQVNRINDPSLFMVKICHKFEFQELTR